MNLAPFEPLFRHIQKEIANETAWEITLLHAKQYHTGDRIVLTLGVYPDIFGVFWPGENRPDPSLYVWGLCLLFVRVTIRANHFRDEICYPGFTDPEDREPVDLQRYYLKVRGTNRYVKYVATSENTWQSCMVSGTDGARSYDRKSADGTAYHFLQQYDLILDLEPVNELL